MIARLLLAFVLACAPAFAAAQACAAPVGAQKVESGRFALYYTTVPAISLNRHFGLDVTVCPKAGVTGPVQLRVDARMPAHQHGMNYKPFVKSTAPNQFKAEGLLFHMPGHWELIFEVEAGGRSDKLVQGVDL